MSGQKGSGTVLVVMGIDLFRFGFWRRNWPEKKTNSEKIQKIAGRHTLYAGATFLERPVQRVHGLETVTRRFRRTRRRVKIPRTVSAPIIESCPSIGPFQIPRQFESWPLICQSRNYFGLKISSFLVIIVFRTTVR